MTATEEPDADRSTTGPIFRCHGSEFVATTLARGPWDPGACHGGAPAALLAAAVDRTPAPSAMQGVRLTYDLVRPVPVDRGLRLDVEVVREGRRVQVLDARLTLAADGTELVRCRALRIRSAELDLPADRPVPGPAEVPLPEELHRMGPQEGLTGEGFWQAVDVRLVTGELGSPGPGVGWFRVVAPLTDATAAAGVAGSPRLSTTAGAGSTETLLTLTPLARAAAAADFGNGIGAPLPMGPFRYVNPDLTVDLHRLPVDGWVSLSAASVAERSGVGLTTGVLGDRRGVIGSSLQSLFIDAG